MGATEIVRAFETGLITEAEAVEQALADDIDEVYERAASATPRWGRPRDLPADIRRLRSR